MSDDDDDDVVLIPQGQLTWWEDCMAWIGWGICEIAFRSPGFAWQYLLYPAWCHSLGGWFYGLAFDRWYRQHRNESWK